MTCFSFRFIFFFFCSSFSCKTLPQTNKHWRKNKQTKVRVEINWKNIIELPTCVGHISKYARRKIQQTNVTFWSHVMLKRYFLQRAFRPSHGLHIIFFLFLFYCHRFLLFFSEHKNWARINNKKKHNKIKSSLNEISIEIGYKGRSWIVFVITEQHLL